MCSEQQLAAFRHSLADCLQQRKPCLIQFPAECRTQVEQECVQTGYEVVNWKEQSNVATVIPLHRYIGLRRTDSPFESPEERLRWMLNQYP